MKFAVLFTLLGTLAAVGQSATVNPQTVSKLKHDLERLRADVAAVGRDHLGAAGGSFLSNDPYESLGRKLHGAYDDRTSDTLRCELEAPYEHEIRDLQGIESEAEWNAFWAKERESRRREAVRRMQQNVVANANHEDVKDSVKESVDLMDEGVKAVAKSGGDPDEISSGPEVEIVPKSLCRRVPSELHAYRTTVIELCQKDGEDEITIGQFKTPTPKSECGMKVIKRFHDIKHGRDTEGMVSLSDFDNRVYVTFRASDDTKDWSNVNLRLIQTREEVKGTDIGRVHRGFHRAMMAVRDQIFETIRPHLAEGKKLTVVGHSLGGALATIFSLHAKMFHPDVEVSCITFGSPRVGDKKFARLFNDLVDNSKRFIATFACKGKTYADSVTTVPPEKMTQDNSVGGAMLATGAKWDWLKRQGAKIASAYNKGKRVVKSTGALVAHRAAIAGVSALTQYQHVGGAELLPVKLHSNAECKDHLASLKMGMSVHGAYRRELLFHKLDEFLITESNLNDWGP